MLTRNYWLVYAAMITGNPSGLKYKVYDGSEFDCKKVTQTSYGSEVLNGIMFNRMDTIVQTVHPTAGVMFGDGTAAAKEDYWLSGNTISGISVSSSETVENSEDGCTKTRVYTIVNNNDTDITIREVGYQGHVPTDAYNNYVALLEHTILDSPITIPAGGVGQVTYTIRMNYPTA